MPSAKARARISAEPGHGSEHVSMPVTPSYGSFSTHESPTTSPSWSRKHEASWSIDGTASIPRTSSPDVSGSSSTAASQPRTSRVASVRSAGWMRPST